MILGAATMETAEPTTLSSDEKAKEIVIKFGSVDFSHPNGVVALRNVSLEIRKAEVVGILGTNGAGKSTLVKHVNGLLKPTHGFVEVFGENTRLTSAAKLSKRVGIVFQNPNDQLFAQSVRSEIEFGLKNFGYDLDIVTRRTEWALNTFSLSEYADRPPMELSGGEKKRLCNALVLAWDPDIVIFDEPTVGQDFEQKEKLVQTIKLLISEGKTVILVTHDVEFIWPLQPRIILMSEGRIVADGSAQEILGDRSKSLEANVLLPQLVDLSTKLGIKGRFPSDEYEARDKITQLLSAWLF
jgi:energy-coupling factor transport system ATP-binding protein